MSFCHYFDKNNQSTADFTPNDKCKQQNKSFFEAKYIPGKKSLAFLFEEINAFNRKLKPENTVSRKKRNAESLLFSLY
jgi:hypothetical protein